MSPVPVSLPCPACGGPVACCVNAPGCWCTTRPPLDAPVPGQGCLCPACLDAALAVRRRLATRTLPAGALGRLGDVAVRLGEILRTPTPRVDAPQALLFAADHGLATEPGLSAYPQAVTAQMVANFASGGAAACVLARAAGATLTVVDVGVAGAAPPPPGVIDARIGPGTRNLLREAAMTRDHAQAALDAGARIAAGLPGNVLIPGEMGIGNTSSATLLVATFTGASVDDCTGRGTGLDDAALAGKRERLRAAFALHRPDAADPLGALAAVGGFEIAAMAGAMLTAARDGRVVLVDGFICTAALLVARALEPRVTRHCVLAHHSAERGHAQALAALAPECGAPLLSLEMRLGEGSGALLALPLLQAASRLLCEMASFESAGVDGPAEQRS